MLEFELKIRSRDIDTLIKQISTYSSKKDIKIVKKAYYFAYESHENQVRLSGEPFIIHPLEVAMTLALLKLDTITISAALLHDVIENTDVSLITLKNKFNDEISMLVDGVTKISSIKSKSKANAQAQSLRKMLIATTKDVRVIIIKLADKLHNMRTIMFHNKDNQIKFAEETLKIYAPIAKRLGMSKISSELEDISFSILYKKVYNEIKKFMSQKENEFTLYFDNIIEILQKKIDELKIKTYITSRIKHSYSIFKKMKKQSKDLDEIYDIRAIRIITSNISECYGVLGIIHSLWAPIPSRFKDFIAVPKSNMYQSLHTTVIGPEGYPLEIQIRTKDMHATAEVGVAAHWAYKENTKIKDKSRVNSKPQLLKNIDIQEPDLKDSREFLINLQLDLYEDEIFVFTPKGKIIQLSKGATPVDFAFHIHSEIGIHVSGAKINNKMVPIKTELRNGDIVDILTSKISHPSESWLKFVKSSKARYKIKNWIKKNKSDHPVTGEEKTKSKTEKVEEVIIPDDEQIKLKQLSKNTKITISVDGMSNVMTKLAQCCQPIPGDNVLGFITRGRGITIHKSTCPSLKRLKGEKERFIEIIWEGNEETSYPVKISVLGLDRNNLLKDLADKISTCNTNIIKMEAESVSHSEANFKFVLEVKNNSHLDQIIQKIKTVKGITEVYKLNEKIQIK